MFTVKLFCLTESKDSHIEAYQTPKFYIRTTKSDVIVDFVDSEGTPVSLYLFRANADRLVVENAAGRTTVNMTVERSSKGHLTVTLPDGRCWIGSIVDGEPVGELG